MTDDRPGIDKSRARTLAENMTVPELMECLELLWTGTDREEVFQHARQLIQKRAETSEYVIKISRNVWYAPDVAGGRTTVQSRAKRYKTYGEARRGYSHVSNGEGWTFSSVVEVVK